MRQGRLARGNVDPELSRHRLKRPDFLQCAVTLDQQCSYLLLEAGNRFIPLTKRAHLDIDLAGETGNERGLPIGLALQSCNRLIPTEKRARLRIDLTGEIGNERGLPIGLALQCGNALPK